MVGNPWVEDKGEDFKMEALIALIDLPITRVNDLEEETGLVTDDDRVEARTQKDQREKDQLEKEKQEREEEEQRLADEAARKAAGEGGEEAEGD